jgi:hypothetical protein
LVALVGASVLAGADADRVAAQFQVPDSLSGWARFQGEIGSYAEVYSSTGGPARRPGSTGRLFLRSDLTLFENVSVGLNLLYSTEGGSDIGLHGSARRQQINQIGITPTWSWGRAYLGSFTDSYSSLTWGGTRVQGAGAAVQPGPVRLGAFVGRAQRAVAGGPLDGAYKRTMAGGRIGYGPGSQDNDGGYVDLVFIRAADDPSSLATPGEIIPGDPTAPGTPLAVTPQENVVMAAVTQLPLLSGRLVWTGEAAVSVFSRDRRAPELTEAAVQDHSSLLRSLITPRASTYGDVAYKARLELRRTSLPGALPSRPRSITGSLGFRYIGAGYVSLGVASLPADQRAVDAAVSVRFPRWSASLRGLRQNDNLLDQKLATTGRTHASGTLTYRLTQRLTTSLRGSYSAVGSDASAPDLRLDYRNWMGAADQTLSLGAGSALRSVGVGYTFRRAGDDNPLRSASSLVAHDARVRGTLQPMRNVTLTPSVGIAVTRQGGIGWATRQTYGAATHVRTGDGRLATTLSVFSSRLPSNDALRVALTTRFRFTEQDLLTASLSSNHVEGLPDRGGGFAEYTFSLQWSRRFQ